MDSIAPKIGWFMLSEADRSAANKFLAKLVSDGTRDELGFAPIHFAFADRFFPGTSIQHAHLRYVFFVAWAYKELLAKNAGSRFSRDQLFEIEKRYSKRLMAGTKVLRNSGISGWTKYAVDDRPIVRASTIYWSALRSWRMVAAVFGLVDAPTEVQLQNRWASLVVRTDDEEGRLIVPELFEGLPRPPSRWKNKLGPLDFKLRNQEAEYIRTRWRTAGQAGAQPLLSRLAEAGVTPKSLWSKQVSHVATESERGDLILAQRAASVACIARAAYAALVERKRNDDRGVDDHLHADALPKLIAEHRDAALALNVDALRLRAQIDDKLVSYIKVVIEWVRENRPLDKIATATEMRERALKNGRAYLSNEKRRRDWHKNEATPLDYRWPVVCNMIKSIMEAA